VRKQCDVECCSGLRCVAACFSLLQSVTFNFWQCGQRDTVRMQCVPVYCSVLQSIAVGCSVVQCGDDVRMHIAYVYMLQCVAVCCSLVQCVAVCCRMRACI